MSQQTKLLTIDFICICLLIFLAYCNITVFYNLYLYLQEIDIPANWRGFLIGCSSLSTIAFFLFASPYLTVKNAIPCALAGALIMIGCGISYLYAHGVASLLLVRLANGAAVYLLSAGCMTLMVSRIAPEHSGQAFSLYSIALLLPYSLVPSVCDVVTPHLPSVAYTYRDMSLLLVPGLAMIAVISRRQRRARHGDASQPAMSLGEMYRNALTPRIGLVLLLNGIYIITFASLFFMAQGLFRSRGFHSVGSYFTIQMFCMIIIRLLGNRLFDKVHKVRLIIFSFLVSSASFALMAVSYSLVGLYASSLLMGIGMGVISPALYGLMFTISSPRFKAVNSNLMMLSLQIGNFLGPVYGAWVMQRVGYADLFLCNAGCCLVGIGLCFLLTSHRIDATRNIANA